MLRLKAILLLSACCMIYDSVYCGEQAAAENEGKIKQKSPGGPAGDVSDPQDRQKKKVEAPLSQQPATDPGKAPDTSKVLAWIKKLDSKKETTREDARKNLLTYSVISAQVMKKHGKKLESSSRMACVKILQEMDNKDAREALAARAIYDKKKDIRILAAAAVKEMGGEDAFNYILKRAFSKNDDTRNNVARAIANIGDKRFVDALVPNTKQKLVSALTLLELDVDHSSLSSMGQANLVGTGTNLPIDLPTTFNVRTRTYVWTIATVAGRDFGKDWRAWDNWWKENREGFKFPGREKP